MDKIVNSVFLVLLVCTIFGLTSGDTYGPPADSYGKGGANDNPRYMFDYSVNDPNTQDIKSQSEQRDGHQVTGEYSLRESDGTTRTVRYKADQSGFTAMVERTGQAQHPATYGKQGGGPSQGYGPPQMGGTGGTSNVGVTKWNNQGDDDKGHKGYGTR